MTQIERINQDLPESWHIDSETDVIDGGDFNISPGEDPYEMYGLHPGDFI